MASTTNTGLNINIGVNSARALQDIKSLNLAVIGLGASFAAIGKNLSNFASDFDKEMRNVNSIAQVSEANFKNLYSS